MYLFVFPYGTNIFIRTHAYSTHAKRFRLTKLCGMLCLINAFYLLAKLKSSGITWTNFDGLLDFAFKQSFVDWKSRLLVYSWIAHVFYPLYIMNSHYLPISMWTHSFFAACATLISWPTATSDVILRNLHRWFMIKSMQWTWIGFFLSNKWREREREEVLW